MKQPVIGFLMDPVEKFDHDGDTSFSLMCECQKRGWKLFYFTPDHLSLTPAGPQGSGFFAPIHPAKGIVTRIPAEIPLSALKGLFIRKEPPFDRAYLQATYILDFVKNTLLMINNPSGIRKANEKIYALRLNRWVPPFIVSADAGQIRKFIRQLKKPAVIKPLDDKGGRGIFMLKPNDPHLEFSLRRATQNGQEKALAQLYLPRVKKGDKRILILDGELLGAFLRKPAKGEFRANMDLGGTAHKTTGTARDKTIVQDLIPLLKRDGLHLVGIDIVDGYLTEVNVTSPAGIPEINQFHRTHLEEKVIDWMESHSK